MKLYLYLINFINIKFLNNFNCYERTGVIIIVLILIVMLIFYFASIFFFRDYIRKKHDFSFYYFKILISTLVTILVMTFLSRFYFWKTLTWPHLFFILFFFLIFTFPNFLYMILNNILKSKGVPFDELLENALNDIPRENIIGCIMRAFKNSKYIGNNKANKSNIDKDKMNEEK